MDIPTSISQGAIGAWKRYKEKSQQESLKDDTTTGTALSGSAKSDESHTRLDKASTVDASVIGPSTAMVDTVDACTQTYIEPSTHTSPEEIIAQSLDFTCGIVITQIALQAEEDTEHRFSIWGSLDPQQRFGRVRSVVAFLWAFKPLGSKQERQALVLGYRKGGHGDEEKSQMKAICEKTLGGDLTKDNIVDLLDELAWLEKLHHRGETQWQLDGAVLKLLAYTFYL